LTICNAGSVVAEEGSHWFAVKTGLGESGFFLEEEFERDLGV